MAIAPEDLAQLDRLRLRRRRDERRDRRRRGGRRIRGPVGARAEPLPCGDMGVARGRTPVSDGNRVLEGATGGDDLTIDRLERFDRERAEVEK